MPGDPERPIVLSPTEHVLFEGANPTFHRTWSQYQLFVVSDQALYIGQRKNVPRIQRIPLRDIRRIRVVPVVNPPTSVVSILYLVAVTPALVWCALWARGTAVDMWPPRAIILSLFLAWFVRLYVASRRDRHALRVETSHGVVELTAPADPYAEEKSYDADLFRRVVDTCRQAGFGEPSNLSA